MTPLAATLKQLRAARGLSQRQLAEAAGIHRAVVQNIEQSLVLRPRRAIVDALADALGVEPDALTTHVYDPPGQLGAEPDVPDDDPAGGLSIGKRLRHWRETRGYSQSLLADRAGLSRQGIQKMEGGSCRVKPSTVRKLAEALAVTVYDLAPDFDTPLSPAAAPVSTDPALATAQALADAIRAYDPGALVVAGPLESDLGLTATPAVAALLSNGDLELVRDKDAWAYYLTRHGDPARLSAALDALAAFNDQVEAEQESRRRALLEQGGEE